MNKKLERKYRFIVMAFALLATFQTYNSVKFQSERDQLRQNCKQCELRSLIEYPENGEIE